MRFIFAKFVGYIGFYNGLGLDKVEIDFSRSTHNIILISGINGCGKSTLMNALNIFPDSSSDFVPNKDAIKELSLIDREGNQYDIHIESLADAKGGRKTTKAFIRKNGTELNENGNVSSYKDIVYNEFDLDSNFLSLTKLSSTSRGLGDKKPAERKRFVSNIISNLEVYNKIFVTLKKKSTIFKSHINTLHTKIENVGTKDQLESQLVSLHNREGQLNDQIISINNEIVSIQAKATLDEDEVNSIKSLNESLESAKNDLSKCVSSMELMEHETKIKQNDIEERLASDQKLYNQYSTDYAEASTRWKALSSQLQTTTDMIQSLKADIQTSDTLDNGLEDKYNKLTQEMHSIEAQLKTHGIPLDTNLVYELSNLINFYSKFTDSVDKFYDGIESADQIDYIINKYNQNDYNNYLIQIDNISNQIKEKQDKIKETQNQIATLSILDNRPKKCNIDNCPFISDAIKLKKDLGNCDLVHKLSKIQEDIIKLSDNISEIQGKIDLYRSSVSKRTEYEYLRDSVLEFKDSFIKFGEDNLADISFLNTQLCNMSLFNKQRDPRRLIDGLNYLKSYESISKEDEILAVQYESYKEKMKLIESTNAKISQLEYNKDKLLKDVSNAKSNMDNLKQLIDQLDINIAKESGYKYLHDEFNKINLNINDIESKLAIYENKSSKALEATAKIQGYKNNINELTNALQPITDAISRIKGQLTLLDSYYQEYNEYSEKYNYIEILKKYCSPTGGGIQTVFMQLYMSKTLELSNQLLSMLFNGEYQLLDFVINESEFRIPFIGGGMPVDDISSGSNSQICIMSMIINLVLLNQASSKYNIAQLDEIDESLDPYNRSQFVNVLYQIINILQIDQLFVIAQSLEVDSANCDIIKLKTYNNTDESSKYDGNIIYDYDTEFKKSLSKTLI